MRISKDAWHYRVWRFTHFFRGEFGEYRNLPRRTNLCQYVSRTILMSIPVGIGFGALVALSILVFVIGNAVTILPGIGLCKFGDEKDEWGRPKLVERFPSITIGTWQVPMPAIVLSSYGLLAIAFIAYIYPWTTLTYAGYGAGVIGALALLYVVAGAAIVVGFRRAERWDGWLLLKQYLEAKRQGICPLVMFDEPNYSATAEAGEPESA